MKLIAKDTVPPRRVSADGQGNPAEGTYVQVLVPEGPNFVMRVFTIEPGGHTPEHSHPWEHEVYVLSGRGEARGGSTCCLTGGDAVYVSPGEAHSFVNTADEAFKFICVIPSDAACGRKEGG